MLHSDPMTVLNNFCTVYVLGVRFGAHSCVCLCQCGLISLSKCVRTCVSVCLLAFNYFAKFRKLCTLLVSTRLRWLQRILLIFFPSYFFRFRYSNYTLYPRESEPVQCRASTHAFSAGLSLRKLKPGLNVTPV